jgi:hypothetical protein
LARDVLPNDAITRLSDFRLCFAMCALGQKRTCENNLQPDSSRSARGKIAAQCYPYVRHPTDGSLNNVSWLAPRVALQNLSQVGTKRRNAETMRRMNRIFTNLSGAEKAEVH